MIRNTLMYDIASPAQKHFGGPLTTFWGTDTKVYVALMALLINLAIVIVGTVVLRALKVPDGTDSTSPGDYGVDMGDTGVEAELTPETPAH